MAEGADFSRHIEFVARAMLQGTHGEPNRALSSPGKELRFGKKGSLSVDLVKGTWHDHAEGEGGGTLDLLKLYGDMDQHEALEWMVQQGLIEPTKRGDRKNEGKFLGFMEHHPEKTFVYHDDKGRVAYEVLKFPKAAPRRYMQRRPAADGGWVFGLQAGTYGKTKGGHWFKAKEGKRYEEERAFDDAPRFLFHLAAVKKAIAAGTPIVLVEGEKDVETIESWGMVATTNAGGAKYWTDGMTAALAGAHIILCSDNDEPGRTRTLMLGAQLRAAAKSVRVLDLSKHWPDMPEKADVSDWRDQAGGTGPAFAKLVEKAPLWQPAAPKSKFGAIGWADMDAEAPEFAYLVDGWLPIDGRSVMGGPSQAGKSFLAMHLGLCVARGVPFLGNQVERRGVYYQAGEGGSGAKKRVLAYRRHYGVSAEDDVPFVFAPAKVDLFSRDGDTAALIEDIKAQALMLSVPLGLVVIDTLATATAGADENSGKDMSVVLANIAKIEKECGCHVMLVHHMNAEGKKLRGHTSVFADVVTVITILNDEQTKVRTATLSKQKDDETGIKMHFELMALKIGFNPKTAKDITSCVVLPKGEKDMLKAEQERQGFSPNQTERRILINLFEAIRRHGKPISDESEGPVQAIGKTVVTYEQFRDVSLERMVDVEDRKRATEQIRKEFARSRDMLVKHKVIGAFRGGDDPRESYLWWDGRPVRGFIQTFPKKDPAAEMWRQREEEAARYASPGLNEVLTDPEIPF